MTERSVHHFERGRSDVATFEAPVPGAGGVSGGDGLRELLGGKGAGLHALAARGFPVPPGFTLSTGWCAAYHEGGKALPHGLREAIARAVEALEERTGRKLGAPPRPLRVAVRSGAARSMPGMMDTILDVDSLQGIVEAVERVFLSFESERAVAYRRRKGLAGLGGTAVVIQEMCPAETAGVAFTADPASGEPVITVEAVRGLGDGLVSGEVTPDRHRLRRTDLQLLEESAAGGRPVLDPGDLREVASLALRVEEVFGHAVDVEWARAGGETWLLQARAVTGAGRAGPARASRLRAEASRLRALRRRGDGARAGGEEAFLVRHNLDQTLSHPTPMTRDVLQALFGRDGGYQGLYRDLGFRPSRAVLEEGFLVIVCGRVFADSGRAAELFYGTGLLRHDREALRRRPELLDEPPPLGDRAAARPLELLRTLLRMRKAQRRLDRLRDELPARFAEGVLPRYLAWCRAKGEEDLAALDLPSLLVELDERVEAVYRRFPREALKLSFLAATAHAELEDLLQRGLGEDAGGGAARTLLSLLGDAGLEQSRLLAALERGEMGMDSFLGSHGHRGAGEMELAQPRWREDPGAASRLARSLGRDPGAALEARIGERRRAMEAEEESVTRKFLAGGGESAAAELADRLKRARELLPFREAWKDHWMRGVDLVRRALLELDRRLGLEGQVFYLTRAELREIAERGGLAAPSHLERIRARREEEALDRSITLPDCLTAEDLEALAAKTGDRGGGGPQGSGAGASAGRDGEPLRGAPLSPGEGEGRAWIATSPGEGCPLPGPFVLVCPSTDPGWTPLLAQAGAVIVERGGALSHGAIVCRDFGVPAVALPGATRLIASGEVLRVDGARGTVIRPGSRPDAVPEAGSGNAARGYRIPPEPYVPRARRGLGRRALGGLLAAIGASVLIAAVPGMGSLVLPSLGAALDWTIEAGWPPLGCIALAAAASAALAAAIQRLSGSPALLSRMRARAGWYRRQIRAARGAGAAPALQLLERRSRQASLERGLELLRPVGWSFLPFCLALLWVTDRLSVEPIRPGTTFSVRAVFRPAPGNEYLRRAGLETGTPGAARILDAAFKKLEPNHEAPALGPYRASWSVEARGEGLVPLAVTTRDERLERSVLVSERREFAPEVAVRFRRPAATPAEGRPGPEIVSLDVEHPPLLVELPGPAFELLNGTVKLVTGGRGLTPSQAALGPITTFLFCAVFLALLLSRATGMR